MSGSGSKTATLVITCYNHARYLGEAIASARAQTRRFDQIMVVDDGSTDATAEVTAGFPEVEYRRRSNGGLAAARNTGLKHATGDYIVFLDADDRLLPDCLAAGLACFEAHQDCAFVYGYYRRISEGGEPLPNPEFDPCPPDAYGAFLHRNLVAMHATVLYKREAVQISGGFDESLRVCEDYDLYLRLARKFRVGSHGTIVADYRRHGSNMSGDLPLMLTTVLAVLKRQQPETFTDPRWRSAWQAGRKNWRHYYGVLLARRAVAGWRDHASLKSVLRDACSLFTLAPRTGLRLLTRAGLPFAPAFLRTSIVRRWPLLDYRPRVGSVDFGEFDRLTPVSREYGFDRGTPVDRYYIDRFLEGQASTIRGRVLEIGDRAYTERFGGDRVTFSDVLNVRADVPGTTIIGDLAEGANIPDALFDCIVLTQTLHLLFDLRSAVRTLHRVLKPGGTLLLTVPGTISQVENGIWQSVWYWGFTRLSLQRLLAEAFGAENVDITQYGNVLSSVALLQGIASEELTAKRLEHRDPLYPLLLAARVKKAP